MEMKDIYKIRDLENERQRKQNQELQEMIDNTNRIIANVQAQITKTREDMKKTFGIELTKGEGWPFDNL